MGGRMLEERIKAAAARMRADLDGVRASLAHRGNRGAGAEAILRTFLREYLPRRLEIGMGEIVDRAAKRSGQADVIVVNEHHPFTFQPEEPGLFFIEGVSAVGEVKSVLTTDELESAFRAARKFKQLTMILPAGAQSYASHEDRERYYTRPPYFVFAFESQLSFETLGDRIREHTQAAYSPGESIDGVFVLDRGYFVDVGKGGESFIIRDAAAKTPFTGWRGQPSDRVLYDMLAWLSIVMPSFVGGMPVLVPYLVPKATP